MSAAYGARMELLQRKREELTAQRQAIEKRVALREATAAEFSAVALQSCKHKWKAQRSAAVAAKKRNDEFVRGLHEAQKQAHDAWSKLQSDQASSSALLAQEKARYTRRVEQVYPAWQEQLQKQRVQKLRGLEDKKRAVERRRYLAKKSFEKEQTLGDLIRKTRHEVEMAENLEQNEVYERELLRTQSTNQAKEVGQSIREVAIEIPGRENGSPSTIANFTAPFSTAMNSRISLPEPPARTHPEKIEENRVARPPAAPGAVATPIGDTLHARVDEDRPVEHQENAVAPEPSIKRTISRKPPAISIPEPIESYVLSSSITETTAESPAGVPLQDDLPEDEADSLDEKTTGDEGRYFTLSADSVSTPSQLDAPSNTIAPSIAAAEDLLKTEEIAAEEIDTNKHIVDVEIVPRTFLTNDTIEVQQPELSLYQDSTSKIASFHDTNPVRESISANLSVTHTSTLDAVEIPVGIREDVELPESPPPSISYGTDLLEPFSLPLSSPVNVQSAEDDMMLSSMQSDDFDLSASSAKLTADTKPTVPSANDAPMQNDVNAVETSAARRASSPEPPSSAPEEVNIASITEKLSPVDRVKALRALISRVEEGAMEGDTLGSSTDTGSTNDSKRELLKMAVGGRQAQIAFFGSDICFELILDISRDLGPVLFPQKAFEGIMNDQKIRKLHQSNKGKELDLWKALSAYLKQLVQLKAIPAATLVDLFVTAFLDHDPDNQRSQRKLRDFLVSVCGSGGSKTSSPRKEAPTPSPPPSPPKQGQRTASPEPAKPEDRVGTPQLLQTAFLQRQSPPKPKVFGIASSSFKGRSSGSSDVLMSMSSGPIKLSQKLMRGGKMNDYSEFEEEEEVDLQNLIGTKSTFASGSSVLGRSRQAAKTSPKGRSATTQATLEEEEDEFDADF
ncbi:hypothetical protein PHYPSEUDO_003170 [Phytophthora pseudosyringae]|uniref:Uncharacterized protein n=1 Tax=Phytophthora pseudosyringae TaxID=221518 RepID=A0A8T1VS14_9STRA|nr:hypothetical protein PHYPSEUDO_003170 [Phytophthora pseudosyringae]